MLVLAAAVVEAKRTIFMRSRTVSSAPSINESA
jgi:hypothetical protein